MFHLFPELPPELRLKIWQYTANFPRVIELDYIDDSIAETKWLPSQWPRTVRVAPNSRSPPAILHVCKEARKEALRYYELENFENKATAYGVQYTHFIYYNRHVDIVYFGEQSNIDTLDTLLRLGIKTPNIAIAYEDFWTTQFEDLPIDSKILHLLHGFDDKDSHYAYTNPPVSGENRGAVGLQEVFFVLSRDFGPSGGNTEPVHLRAATPKDVLDLHEELDEEERNYLPFPGSQFPSISKIKAFNKGRNLRNMSRWIVARPHISFASLDTDQDVEICHDRLRLELKGAKIQTIEEDNYAVIRKIMANTGCLIRVDAAFTNCKRYRLKTDPSRWISRYFRNVEFLGTEEAIKSAMSELEAFRATGEDEEEVGDVDVEDVEVEDVEE